MMNRTVTIFDWLSFAKGVELDAPSIDEKVVLVFAEQMDDETCRVLVFRAWYYVGGVLKCFVGDRMSGPLTVWVKAAQNLIQLGQLARRAGVTLQWDDLTDPSLLPVAGDEATPLTPAPVAGPDLFSGSDGSPGG